MGVEIEITPAGKSTKRLTLLSGGEKSMTALAFLFAVFLARPCPFYILDEVEAALDDLNIDRFLDAPAPVLRPRAVHRRHPPEAHDGGRRLPLRRLDGGNGVSKVICRKLPARPGRSRRQPAEVRSRLAQRLLEPVGRRRATRCSPRSPRSRSPRRAPAPRAARRSCRAAAARGRARARTPPAPRAAAARARAAARAGATYIRLISPDAGRQRAQPAARDRLAVLQRDAGTSPPGGSISCTSTRLPPLPAGGSSGENGRPRRAARRRSRASSRAASGRVGARAADRDGGRRHAGIVADRDGTRLARPLHHARRRRGDRRGGRAPSARSSAAASSAACARTCARRARRCTPRSRRRCSRTLDEETWERLEEALICADVGARTTAQVVEQLEREAEEGDLAGGEALQRPPRRAARRRSPATGDDRIDLRPSPTVILVVGVNGTGKTTTIGKLAWHLRKELGQKVVIGAADTFRAAAVEQLERWARARRRATSSRARRGLRPRRGRLRRDRPRARARRRRGHHRHRRPPAHAGRT